MESGEYSNKSSYANVHSSTIHDSQNVEAKCPSAGERTYKIWSIHTMEYCSAINGVRYWCMPLRHERTLKTRCSAKEAGHGSSGAVWLHLHEASRISKCRQTESRLVAAGLGEGRNEKRPLTCMDENSLKLETGECEWPKGQPCECRWDCPLSSG